jgi:hypothetical protein
MRKLNNPMPSGGAPFTNEDLNDVFQTEVWAALQGLLSEYNADAEGVIVSGCVVTPNASNFDMTAGIVYLNGEFMRVDAVTNQTFTKYIKAAPVTNVARVFEDTVSKTFIVEKKAEVSATVDAGGQEITISSIESSFPRRLINLGSDGSIAWTTSGLSLGSGVTNSSFKFKKTNRNTVKLDGWLTKSAGVNGFTFATLPSGYRPSTNKYFSIPAYGFTGGPGWSAFIDTAGNIQIFENAPAAGPAAVNLGGSNYSFDCVEFEL